MPGFEPGSEAWEASVLTAGLQSQRRGIMFLIFHSWFRFLPFSIPFDRRRVISPTERSIPRRHVFYSISLLDVPSDSWSRGYDVALTRRRSPVQFRPGPPCFQILCISCHCPSIRGSFYIHEMHGWIIHPWPRAVSSSLQFLRPRYVPANFPFYESIFSRSQPSCGPMFGLYQIDI